MADIGAPILVQGERRGFSIPGLSMFMTFARKKPLGGVALVLVIVLIVTAIFAPFVARYDPNFIFKRDNPGYEVSPTLAQLANNPDIGSPITVDSFETPNWTHWFGTDKVGHDIYARVIHGTRLSLIVGLGASAIAVSVGLIIGVASGFYRGAFDIISQRLIDALQAFPGLVLLLLLVQVAEPSVRNTVLAMGVIGVPTVTRIIRSSTLVVQSTDYVEAARSIGATNTRILWRHVVPNIFSVVLIAFSIGIGAYIIFEATISFLGVGPRGVVSWGKMVQEGRGSLDLHPWLTVFAGLAIAIVVISFNFLGDAIRDVLDPRLRGT
jgi:peptide/nickel transport system permease protein